MITETFTIHSTPNNHCTYDNPKRIKYVNSSVTKDPRVKLLKSGYKLKNCKHRKNDLEYLSKKLKTKLEANKKKN